MPIVESPSWGAKPSMTLLGGSNSGLATPSTPFLPSGGRSIALTGAGWRTVSFFDIYRTQPRVGIAVRRVAEAIARLNLQTFRELDELGDTRERDRRHPAARLVSRPRPRQRGFHLRWDLALSLYVHGNYVAWKRRPRAGAPPVELWTLDWRLLIPHVAGGRVLGWTWTGEGIPGLRRGEVVLVENTVHVAFGAPGGGEVGISPLEQLGVTIRSEDALQRYGEASMRHGTRFGMAAILDPKVKADRVIRDGVREELMDAHGGVDNAFKPAILGGGVTDLKPLAEQSAVEAELLGQRRVNAEEINGLVGIPAPVAGVLEDQNYGALKELHRMLYLTLLGGPLGLVSESLQAQIIDEEPAWGDDAGEELAGRFYEFSLDGVLKGDAKERWETYGLALDHGGLTLNDVRKRENLKPYADPRADEPLIAANNVRPLSSIGTGPTGNGTPGRRVSDQASGVVLELVARHTARGLERAARGAGAGRSPLEALDRDRVERELRADLEAAGFAPAAVPRLVADELARDLEGAKSVADVRAVEANHVPQEEPNP